MEWERYSRNVCTESRAENKANNKEGVMDKRESMRGKVILAAIICVFILSVVMGGGIISKAKGAETEKPRYSGILKIISSNMAVNLGYPAAGYTLAIISLRTRP